MAAYLDKEFLSSRPVRPRLALRAQEAVAAAVRATLGRWRDGRRRRLAIRQLSGFDDRRLADIGITRGEIEAVVERLMRGARPPA